VEPGGNVDSEGSISRVGEKVTSEFDVGMGGLQPKLIGIVGFV